MRSVGLFESTLIVNSIEIAFGVIREGRVNAELRRWLERVGPQSRVLVHVVGLEEPRAIKQPRFENLCGRERILAAERARTATAATTRRVVCVLVLSALEIGLNVLHEKHAYVVVAAEFVVDILVLKEIGDELEQELVLGKVDHAICRWLLITNR